MAERPELLEAINLTRCVVYTIPIEIAEKGAWSDEKFQPTACDSTKFAFSSFRNRPPHEDEIKVSALQPIGAVVFLIHRFFWTRPSSPEGGACDTLE